VWLGFWDGITLLFGERRKERRERAASLLGILGLIALCIVSKYLLPEVARTKQVFKEMAF
jgi:hypothetical protein